MLKPFERWKWEEINLTFGNRRVITRFAPLMAWFDAAKAQGEIPSNITEAVDKKLY